MMLSTFVSRCSVLAFTAAYLAVLSHSMTPVHASSSTSYYFKKYEDYACRDEYGNKGSDGKEFDLYKGKSREWCIEKCEYIGYDCKGFEYVEGEDRCEIWKEDIKKAYRKYGFDCYVQVDKDYEKKDEDFKVEDHKEDDYEEELIYIGDYYSWKDYACRTKDGGDGKGKYDVYEYVDYEYCKHICDDDDDCKAWEYYEEKSKCEIWKYRPGAVTKKDGYYCNVKYW